MTASFIVDAPSTSDAYALPDGNKRLAWQSLTLFLVLNGHDLRADPDEAVSFMLGVAAGEIDQERAEVWITERMDAAG